MYSFLIYAEYGAFTTTNRGTLGCLGPFPVPKCPFLPSLLDYLLIGVTTQASSLKF